MAVGQYHHGRHVVEVFKQGKFGVDGPVVAGAQQQRVGGEAGIAQGRNQQQVHVGGGAAVGIVRLAQRFGGKIAGGAVVAHGRHHQGAHGGRAGRHGGVQGRQGRGRFFQKAGVVEAAAEVVVGQQPGVDFFPGAGQVVVGLVGPLLAGQLKVEAGGVVGQRGHVGLGPEGGQALQHPAALFGGSGEVETARDHAGRRPAAVAHGAVQHQRGGAHVGVLHIKGPAGLVNDVVLVESRNADPVFAPAHRNGALKRPVLEVEQVVRYQAVGELHHRALAHVGQGKLLHVHVGRALFQKHARGFEAGFLHLAVHQVVGEAAQVGHLFRVLVAVVQRDFHRSLAEAGFFQDFDARNPLKHHLKAAAAAFHLREPIIAEHHGRRGTIGHEGRSRQVLRLNLTKLDGSRREFGRALGLGLPHMPQDGQHRQQRHAPQKGQ